MAKIQKVQDDCGAPDIKGMAQKLHQDLHQMVMDFKTNNKDHKSVADSTSSDPIFAQLENVIQNGGQFPHDSAVARRFYADLKNDPELKKQKEEECRGKGKEVLLAFKHKWATTKLSKVSLTKSRTETITDLVALDAEYCTLDRVWDREGRTEAAWDTSVTFMQSALGKFQAGVGFHGHPFLKYDDMRETTMVAEGWALGVCGGGDGGGL